MGSATLILTASLWIPIVGPFVSLLTPLPFLYYSSKLDPTQGLKLVALTILTIGLLGYWTGHMEGIFFAVQFSLVGLLLSILFRKGLDVGQTVMVTTGFLLALGFAFLGYAAIRKEMGLWELMGAYLEENMGAGFRAYEEMGASPEDMAAFRQYANALTNVLLRIFPSLMIVGSGFAVWLNVVLARPLFRATGLDFPDFQLGRWRAPENLVWLLLASGFALFFTSGSIQSIALNTFIVVMAVYVFHGLSIVVFFLEKYHVPSWFRIGMYLLLALQQLFLVVLALAGLVDLWVDFRKTRRQPETDFGEGGE